MTGRAALDRPTKLTTSLPESVRGRLDIHLFSEAQGRVPKGAYQEFLEERINEFFAWKILDLHPFGFPEGYFIKGPPVMIQALEQHLKEQAA